MHELVAHELNDADEAILELLVGGRNLPQNLADELGYSRQYVQNRLQLLKAADYARNRGGGLYEITDEGRAEISAGIGEIDVEALQDALADAFDAWERGYGEEVGEALKRIEALLESENDA